MRKLTVAGLERMMAFAERPETRERAAALGAALAQEDGIAAAVGHIETYLGARPDDRKRLASESSCLA